MNIDGGNTQRLIQMLQSTQPGAGALDRGRSGVSLPPPGLSQRASTRHLLLTYYLLLTTYDLLLTAEIYQWIPMVVASDCAILL